MALRNVRTNQLRISAHITNNMESISTYSEARNEYLKQLSTWIVPYMIQHYRNVWSEAQKIGGGQREMVVFQEKCAEVPKWNQDIIDLNVGKLLDSCRCDYLEELMAAVFIAHTKVLIAIRVSSRHKKLQITLPKLDHFIHRIFSECARSFWKTPFLFLDDAKPIEMQKNLLQAEVLCSESIASAVRSLLPIKSILNEYLSDDVMSAEPVVEEAEEIKPIVGGAKAPVSEAAAIVPTVSEPLVSEPLVSAPLVSAPMVSEPVVSEPVVSEATVSEPVVSEAAVSEATVSEATISEATIREPVVSEAMVSEAPNILVPELQMPVPDEEEIVIDTEPSVRFSDYDNVFDENKEQVGTFSYNPKGDAYDDTPELRIMEDSEKQLSEDLSVTNLEASGSDLFEVDGILE